jgi:hypothetical protein
MTSESSERSSSVRLAMAPPSQRCAASGSSETTAAASSDSGTSSWFLPRYLRVHYTIKRNSSREEEEAHNEVREYSMQAAPVDRQGPNGSSSRW